MQHIVKMPDTITLCINLLRIKPLITRTFKVSSDSSMCELHFIIQEVMGWNNSHLYRFEVGDVMIAPKDPYGFNDFSESKDDRKVKVGKVFAKVGSKAKYEYDFGDGWMHTIVLLDRSDTRTQQSTTDAETEVLPLVISGENACPPDDCGGPIGYKDRLDVLNNPKHPEYKNLRAWTDGMVMAGPKFDPKRYSVDDKNYHLKHLGRWIQMYEEMMNDDF